MYFLNGEETTTFSLFANIPLWKHNCKVRLVWGVIEKNIDSVVLFRFEIWTATNQYSYCHVYWLFTMVFQSVNFNYKCPCTVRVFLSFILISLFFFQIFLSPMATSIISQRIALFNSSIFCNVYRRSFACQESLLISAYFVINHQRQQQQPQKFLVSALTLTLTIMFIFVV